MKGNANMHIDVNNTLSYCNTQSHNIHTTTMSAHQQYVYRNLCNTHTFAVLHDQLQGQRIELSHRATFKLTMNTPKAVNNTALVPKWV